jgi:hypothetical protein
MARRKRALADTVACALWWASPLAAGIVYLFLSYGLPTFAEDPASRAAYARVADEAWLVSLLLLVPAPFAAIVAWRERRRLIERQVLGGTKRPLAPSMPGSGAAARQPDDSLLAGLIRLCPRCGSKMVVRMVPSGPQAGQRVWGCSAFPRCRATEPYEG